MAKKVSRFQKMRADALALLDERAAWSVAGLSRGHRFVHFWVMVWRSFSRNRCPVRASALAYATVLALIPMLAVAMSISSAILKKEGENQIDQFIMKLVASVTTMATVNTNSAGPAPAVTGETTNLLRPRRDHQQPGSLRRRGDEPDPAAFPGPSAGGGPNPEGDLPLHP